jgi:hypothetical protein
MHYVSARSHPWSPSCSGNWNLGSFGSAHPLQLRPFTNLLKINLKGRVATLSKALLTAGLLGAASVSAGSANAADTRKSCVFGGYVSDLAPKCTDEWASSTTQWELGDKIFKFTEFSVFDHAAPPRGLFSFIWDDLGAPGVSPTDIYNVLVDFIPSVLPPVAGSYSYTLQIKPAGVAAGYTFKDVELDVNHSGVGQVVTKTIAGIPDLISTNGAPVGPVPLSGTFISVTDTWSSTKDGRISSISNVYTQTDRVPGPLPLLGAGAAFGFSRRIRRRIKGVRLA